MLKRFAMLLMVLSLAWPAVASADDEAQGVVQTLCDRLLLVMKQSSELGFQGRAEKLTDVITQSYDMQTATKATLGVAFGKLSEDEAKQLTNIFTRFSIYNYADQFDGWNGETFEIGAPRPSNDGAVIVPSRIVAQNGQGTEIDYLMHQVDGHWKIIDVLLDGTISQTAVRRSEFVSIFRKDGFAGLMDMLNHKIAAMGTK